MAEAHNTLLIPGVNYNIKVMIQDSIQSRNHPIVQEYIIFYLKYTLGSLKDSDEIRLKKEQYQIDSNSLSFDCI